MESMAEHTLEELTCLYEIASTLASTLDLREALERALSVLSERFELKRGTITIFNPRTGEIQIEVAHGLSEEARRRGRYRPGEGITGEVVATGQPIIVPQISEDPRFLNRTRSRREDEKKSLSFICVPIKSGGQVLGTLSVDRPTADTAELGENLRFLTIVSGLIAQTVAKLQALEEERAKLVEENLRLKHELRDKYQFENFVATSSRMQEVL